MDEIEAGIDPLDVAADEAAEILSWRKESGLGWPALIGELQQKADNAQRRLGLAMRLQAAFSADGGQLPLFPNVVVPEPKEPRAKRRRMMHEINGLFRCPKCQATAPVDAGLTEAARKRGTPCPKCNVAATPGDQA